MFGRYNITTGTRAEILASTTTQDAMINSGELINGGIIIAKKVANTVASSDWRTYCFKLVSFFLKNQCYLSIYI
jgi:hypothetical protein